MEQIEKTEDIVNEIIEKEEIKEMSDEELLELLEENPVDYEEDVYDERDEDLINEFSVEDTTSLEDFDIDKYLKDNFSFKEIESIPFEEFKEKQLENPDVQSILKLYEKGYKLKDLDTFDDFIKFKQKNIHVYMITIGLPFEYQLFGLEPKIFICKAFTTSDYSQMLKENPNADHDIDFFNDYMLSKCILFPDYRIEDIPKLEVGISDVLLPAIMKNSRFDANYQIKRL